MSDKVNRENKVLPKVMDISGDELERIKRNVYRSDLEKLQLFTQMLRRNYYYKRAKVIHKP